MRRVMRHCSGLWLLGVLCGCAVFATGPLDVLTYEQPTGETANRRLFIFMRGMGGSHRSFEEEGLVADVRGRGLPFDMIAPNAHIGYYLDRTLTRRLKAEVIDPARSRGYTRIWLIGFSMGGLGSLLYLIEHPEEIEGVCLISPYLGDPDIIEEIESVGGVRKWNPGVYHAQKDWQRMLWHWLKKNVAGNPGGKVYLGYGSEDTYMDGAQLLATVLPAERLFVVRGGHTPETFKTLWYRFLDRGSYLEPGAGQSTPK